MDKISSSLNKLYHRVRKNSPKYSNTYQTIREKSKTTSDTDSEQETSVHQNTFQALQNIKNSEGLLQEGSELSLSLNEILDKLQSLSSQREYIDIEEGELAEKISKWTDDFSQELKGGKLTPKSLLSLRRQRLSSRVQAHFASLADALNIESLYNDISDEYANHNSWKASVRENLEFQVKTANKLAEKYPFKPKEIGGFIDLTLDHKSLLTTLKLTNKRYGILNDHKMGLGLTLLGGVPLELMNKGSSLLPILFPNHPEATGGIMAITTKVSDVIGDRLGKPLDNEIKELKIKGEAMKAEALLKTDKVDLEHSQVVEILERGNNSVEQVLNILMRGVIPKTAGALTASAIPFAASPLAGLISILNTTATIGLNTLSNETLFDMYQDECKYFDELSVESRRPKSEISSDKIEDAGKKAHQQTEDRKAIRRDTRFWHLGSSLVVSAASAANYYFFGDGSLLQSIGLFKATQESAVNSRLVSTALSKDLREHIYNVERAEELLRQLLG